MTGLRDRMIIVTGAAAGIGRAIALSLADAGVRVAALDLDGEGAARVAAEARERGAAATIGLSCDIRVEDDIERAVAAAVAELGLPLGLCANAGVGTGGGLLHDTPRDQWDHVIATNLTGVYLTCKHALRAMMAGGRGGSIVCTSSPGAFVALAAGGVPAYSASKAGVSALVRCLALDYAPFGIRVNAIVPGATETQLMWDNVPTAEIERMRKIIDVEVPLGRLARPEEPARAAVWLLSDDASYVTGSHLVCDGGVLAKASISV